MDVLSLTNSAIRLHKSASDLTTLYEHKNAQQGDVLSNFCTLPISKSFLKFWRRSKSKENDSCIEIWRLKKDKEEGMRINFIDPSD